jgi:hypothetical protein
MPVAQQIAMIRHSPEPQPFEHLIDTGLLLAINQSLFAHRGYMLVIDTDDEGVALGFRLEGDGREGIIPFTAHVGVMEARFSEVLWPHYPTVGEVR